MLTANVPELMKLLNAYNIAGTIEKLLEDENINHVRYNIAPGENFVIFNAAKSLHTPETNEQMLAKGLVVLEYEFNGGFFYETLCVPFPKFYNSFEGVPTRELPDIALNYRAEISRKMDGTLINVWYYNEEAYFSTRGRILNFEKNDFWDLVQKVIENKGYTALVDGSLSTYTLMLELIGPSNVILERYMEDDLVLIGATDMRDNYLQFFPEYTDERVPRIAEVYEANSPKELIESWDNVCEGVVVNYLDENDGIVYRVKFKQEAYLNLLKAKSFYQATPVLELLVTHRFATFAELKNYLEKELEGYAFLEELIHIYHTEYDNEFSNWTSLLTQTTVLFGIADKVRNLETRKERYLTAQALSDSHQAGLVMGILDGKLDNWDVTEKLYKRMLK